MAYRHNYIGSMGFGGLSIRLEIEIFPKFWMDERALVHESDKAPTNGEDSQSENLRQIVKQATAPMSDQDVPRSRQIAQFAFFPLAIVVVGVMIYLFLTLLTGEDQTPNDYLNRVKVGGLNSRWQAAYELSRVLADQRRHGRIDSRFARELIDIFESSSSDDPRVRRYLALAMGLVSDPSIVPVLIETLNDPDDETRIYVMASLGRQGDTSAVLPLLDMVSNEDSGIQKAAIGALGQLKDARARPALVVALRDRESDVRWNAALQLAGMKDDAGVDVLAEMLNRAYLNSFPRMSELQKRDAMVKAIYAIGKVRAGSMIQTLERLRKKDPDMKVRQAAIEVLKEM